MYNVWIRYKLWPSPECKKVQVSTDRNATTLMNVTHSHAYLERKFCVMSHSSRLCEQFTKMKQMAVIDALHKDHIYPPE